MELFLRYTLLMLAKRKKLSRSTFPKHNEPKLFWDGSVLRIHAFRSTTSQDPLFAVVVAKKFAKHAVDRNHFKRSVLSIVEGCHPDFYHHLHKKFIFLPKIPLQGMNRTAIAEDIALFLRLIK